MKRNDKEERKAVDEFCKLHNIKENNRIMINGMLFDVDFRFDPYKKEVTAWVSSEEDIPAETALNWLASLGLRPEKKEVEVKWAK